jgi:F420-dependent oxidoreductase-like protein
MAMSVKFGVFVPQGWRLDLAQIKDPVEKYEAMTRAAQTADATAFDSIWLYDHFHTVPTPELEATFEVWTATATLSRDTKRINIGQMVGCNGYRNPALYAKIASTVDVASHGRLFAGIGAGWHEQEWKAYGYPWWETKERMAHFREAVEIIHKMWTEDYPTFHGKHYTVDKPINEPKSAKPGRKIPLWIGGGGEQVTLKLVAKFGDACNVGGDLETIKHKLNVLENHCRAVGRDPSEIIRSSQIRFLVLEPGQDGEKASAGFRGAVSYDDFRKTYNVGTIDDLKRQARGMIDAGIDYVIIYLCNVAYQPEIITRVADQVIPEFA